MFTKHRQCQTLCRKIQAQTCYSSWNIKWGDSITNKNGLKLDDYTCDNNLACISPNAWTFRHTNGGSIIDLALTSPSVSCLYNSSSVDEDIELLLGALQRGHLPIIHQFKEAQATTTKPEMTYKDLENTDWEHWATLLSQKIGECIGEDLANWNEVDFHFFVVFYSENINF